MISNPRRAFVAARVANGDLDGWLSDHAVIVEGEHIDSIVPRAQLPGDIGETSELVDLGDVSLLPGLIERVFTLKMKTIGRTGKCYRH